MKDSIPSFVLKPTYDMLHKAAIDMCKVIRKDYDVDYVVAPVRGGLMFGVIASHKLRLPLICVNYSSKIGNGDDKNHKNVLPKIKKGSTILLVDDIADSGQTLSEIKQQYEKKGVTVVTAVFHWKKSSIIEPDFYWWRLPKDSPFVWYPYERVDKEHYE